MKHATSDDFRIVTWDAVQSYYVDEDGTPLEFPKLLRVRLDGEVLDAKLSYTTEYDSAGERVLRPCIRVDGARYNLDDDALEIASDCLVR